MDVNSLLDLLNGSEISLFFYSFSFRCVHFRFSEFVAGQLLGQGNYSDILKKALSL